MAQISGNQRMVCEENNITEGLNERIHSAIVDQTYLAVASHVESSLKQKIILGEYVDFVKRIPCDRVVAEDEQRMELISKGGMTYYYFTKKKKLYETMASGFMMI